MSTGRKYIEAMVEGINTLDLAGSLNVEGATALGATELKRNLYTVGYGTTGSIDIPLSYSNAVIGVSGSNITASLPTAVGNGGVSFTFFITSANQQTDQIRIAAQSGQTINGWIVGSGSAGVTIENVAHRYLKSIGTYPGEKIAVVSNGTGWFIDDTITVSVDLWEGTNS